jgi:hypothetical protein
MAKTTNPADPKQEPAAQEVDDAPQKITADLRKFNRAQAAVTLAVTGLQAIKVVSGPEDLDKAMEALKKGKEVEGLIEKKRKDLGDPFYQAKQQIDKYAKDLTAKLPPAIDAVKKLVLAYNAEEERKKKEARTINRRLQLVSVGFKPVEDSQNYAYNIEHDDNLIVRGSEIENYEDSAWTQKVSDMVVRIQEIKSAAAKLEKESDDFFGDGGQPRPPEINHAPAPVHVGSFGGGSKSIPAVKGVSKVWTFEITDETLVPRAYLCLDEKKIREAVTAGTRDIPGVRIFQDSKLSIR